MSGHCLLHLLRILSILQLIFEETCFPLEADHFHPFKRVAVFGEGINNKFHFNVDRAADVVGDASHAILFQHLEKIFGKSFLMIKEYTSHSRNHSYMSGIERDKLRVKETAEVFTPTYKVQEMLDEMELERPYIFTDENKSLMLPFYNSSLIIDFQKLL